MYITAVTVCKNPFTGYAVIFLYSSDPFQKSGYLFINRINPCFFGLCPADKEFIFEPVVLCGFIDTDTAVINVTPFQRGQFSNAHACVYGQLYGVWRHVCGILIILPA